MSSWWEMRTTCICGIKNKYLNVIQNYAGIVKWKLYVLQDLKINDFSSHGWLARFKKKGYDRGRMNTIHPMTRK